MFSNTIFSISSKNSLPHRSVEEIQVLIIHTSMYIWEAGDMFALYVCVHICKRKLADKHACEVSSLLKEED